jgi:hypothetical protein
MNSGTIDDQKAQNGEGSIYFQASRQRWAALTLEAANAK